MKCIKCNNRINTMYVSGYKNNKQTWRSLPLMYCKNCEKVFKVVVEET